MENFKKGQQIKAGNFIVSIGSFDTGDVAIISKSTGDFSKLQSCKRSKTLRKIKRNLKSWLNNDETFTFQFMTPDTTNKLIDILKNK